MFFNTSVLNKRSVNTQKVTDHHALLITGNQPKDFTEDEQTIYVMIAGRMLESFSQKCVKDVTTITFSSGDAVFEVKGSVIRQAGWRGVFAEQEETGEDEAGNLPEVQQGEIVPVVQSEVLQKQTKPNPNQSIQKPLC